MQVGSCFIHSLSLSSSGVADGVKGRRRRGEVMNVLFKKSLVSSTQLWVIQYRKWQEQRLGPWDSARCPRESAQSQPCFSPQTFKVQKISFFLFYCFFLTYVNMHSLLPSMSAFLYTECTHMSFIYVFLLLCFSENMHVKCVHTLMNFKMEIIDIIAGTPRSHHHVSCEQFPWRLANQAQWKDSLCSCALNM